MEVQGQTAPAAAPTGDAGDINTDAGAVNAPINNGAEMPAQQPASNDVDLSGLMSADNPETFDRDKVMELHRNAEKWKADKQFFQTKYQQSVKDTIPETAEEYGNTFKPDSMYEKAMEMDGVKDMQSKLYKHAKENGITTEVANSMFDFMMKTAVESGDIDLRSEEQIAKDTAAEQKAMEEKRLEIINPMLEDLHRSKDENDAIIDNFINGKNIFTQNPQMKDFLDKVSKQTAVGYQLVTMINNAFDMGNVPTVTGTIATKDQAAFSKAFAAETDPDVRDSMLKEFHAQQGGK